MAGASSQIARSVNAGRTRRPAAFYAPQHRRRHVPPTWNEGREPAGGAADDEKMDVIRARHNRNAGVEVALVPARQIAVVNLAVAVLEGELAKQIARIQVQVVADVVAGPALAGDRARMLGTQHA